MRRLYRLYRLLLSLLVASLPATAGGPTPPKGIPAFPILANDLALTRSAQPLQYLDKVGPRAALLGNEAGNCELWVWPWKPLRSFELSFLLGTSTQPILSREIVRTVSATPEVTTLTYAHESFSVREHILVPRGEPGAIILLEVHTTSPLTIVGGFIPVMQPMWPGGIGGQFSYWDDESHAYVISEGQWRAMFLAGSPAARQMAAPPAHMFADNPIQFAIDVAPGETDGIYIPIVFAGALPDPATGKMSLDSVKAVYGRLWKDAARYYREDREYFAHLRSSTLQVTTPDRKLNLALEWGKVALDNLLIDNPRLGHGMVAGYGLSGGGGRPGFAWFFGGDAFVNVLAMNAVGMFEQSRDALAFTQKWQRQENFPVRKKNPTDPAKDVGKMAHELSQSDGPLCDWWNDYHYGYNHADTTPWYIVAMGDYVRTSGDVAFLKASWNSVKQAYDWCLSKDSDGDGLMDLKGAGLGALEFGKLVGIYADVYTCGVWVQAVKEMRAMAEIVGDTATAGAAERQFARAKPQLERKFWMEKEGWYSYGATEKGDQVREKTPWSGTAMMFGLLDTARSDRSMEALNGSDLCTDWGVRSLSKTSALFEPTNYNYGAVWPFIASFYTTAQFRHHASAAGYQVLTATVEHAFDNGLGVVPEVFSGEMNTKLAEGYHHQGFSTTGYLLPLVRGLLGLEVDALAGSLTFRPETPVSWRSAPVALSGLRVGAATLSLAESSAAGSRSLTTRLEGSSAVRVVYAPVLEPGEELLSSALTAESRSGQAKVEASAERSAEDLHVAWRYLAEPGRSTFRMDLGGAPVGFEPAPVSDPGATNQNVRVVSRRRDGKNWTLALDGKPGRTYRIAGQAAGVRSVEGATLDGNTLVVTFPAATTEFVRKRVILRLGQ
jgi:glycogen debranching enzyme